MGTVKTWNIRIPDLSGDLERRIYLYLPDQYDGENDRNYPVMYMFDGHNVFFDCDATYGKSWGMYEYMNRTGKDLIIVAVECNRLGNSRLEEYCPVDFEFKPTGKIKGRGAVYMDWLTNTLKPYIDSQYRTAPDRNNTFICGSSMGGLMALYAVCKYNHIFGGAACLSPSLWVDPPAIEKIINSTVMLPDTRIYMDYGSEELPYHEAMMDTLLTTARILLSHNADLTFRIVPGGTHSEASWEKQIPIFLECLTV